MASDDDSALDAWADLDLMAHFARPESVTRDAAPAGGPRERWLTKIVDGLDWILGALVFLPLLFTWTGLAMATSAYGDLTAQNPKAAARPFLQLWQTGFEGNLHSWFEFGHVALVGCVALFALLSLTLLHGNRRAAADRAEEKAEYETRAALVRLVPVLTEAQLILNAHRFASPARFAQELNAAGGKIQRMHTKAVATQEQLAEAAEALRESLEKAEARLAEAEEEVRPLERAVSRLADTARESGEMIRTAVRELEQPLAQVGDRLGDIAHGHAEALERARDGLLTAGDDLRDNVRASTDELRDQIRAAIGDLSDTLRTTTEGLNLALQNTTGSLSDTLRVATGNLGDTLSKSTERLESTVAGNNDEVRLALADAAQRVEEAVNLLAAAQRGFTTGVEVVADLNARLIDGVTVVADRSEQAAGVAGGAVSEIVVHTRALEAAARRFADLVGVVENIAKDGQVAKAAMEEDSRKAAGNRRVSDDNRRASDENRRRSEEARRQIEDMRRQMEEQQQRQTAQQQAAGANRPSQHPYADTEASLPYPAAPATVSTSLTSSAEPSATPAARGVSPVSLEKSA
jgi:hypothetical protein